MNRLFHFSAASAFGAAAASGVTRSASTARRIPQRDKYHFATIQSLEDSMYPDYKNSSPFPSMEATMDLCHYGFGARCAPRETVCYDRYGMPHSAPCKQHSGMDEQALLSYGVGKKLWT